MVSTAIGKRGQERQADQRRWTGKPRENLHFWRESEVGWRGWLLLLLLLLRFELLDSFLGLGGYVRV